MLMSIIMRCKTTVLLFLELNVIDNVILTSMIIPWLKELRNNHTVFTIAVLLISANTTCTKPPSAILCAYSF